MTFPPLGEVQSRVAGDVGWLTLHRPHKRNAISSAMLDALPLRLLDMQRTPGITAIALCGAEGTFGAGADLEDVLAATNNATVAHAYCKRIVDAVAALIACPLPVIAVIEGIAAGASMELALAADMRVAEQSAHIIFPFARLGVSPDGITVQRLSALVGPSVARRILFSAQALRGPECVSVGLVDGLVEDGCATAWVDALAATFRGNSSYAVAAIKANLNRREPLSHDDIVRNMAASFIDGDVRAGAHLKLAALKNK